MQAKGFSWAYLAGLSSKYFPCLVNITEKRKSMSLLDMDMCLPLEIVVDS